MYIKGVVIKGFKTYRNETIIENFSPHHNIVIGSNGSGKSNFFAAIRFVLSDDYSNLKREERQGLIHQGAGSVMSASVEIIFHDPDNRVILSSGINPRPNNEVFIRRTVGLKKDDYQINDRNVTKADIVRMLESAGFSMSNPYNIVPQGRIVALTNAKDKERLQLLEDVVGAKSFETKLRASLKKMDETEFKRNQIIKEMSELNGKLKEMEEERKELEKYNNLERDRKVLQFTLFDRELNDLINQIESLDNDYNSTVHSSEQYIQELDKREEMIEQVTKVLQSLENKLKIANVTDLEQARSKQTEVVKKASEIKIKIDELKDTIHTHEEQNKIDNRKMSILNEEIEKRSAKVAKIQPRFNELAKEEAEYKLKLGKLKQRQRDLFLKKGSYARFKSKEERDNWIKNELTEQSMMKSELETSDNALLEEKKKIEEKLSRIDDEIEELRDSAFGPGITGELEDVSRELTELKEKYSTRIDDRKELWRSEQRLQTLCETLENDMKIAERNVGETMNRSLANGIRSIKEISDKLKLSESSVFGTLGELIKVSEKYKTCAEVVGGNSLFHIVVDTEETASLLMQELYNLKGGRVTFIPLNRIYEDPNISFPTNDQSSSFTPLMKKIKYDPKFEKAVKHVFGKTIVVKDLASGLKIAKKHKLNAITLDGDRADSRGVLTGGYNDLHKKTRIDSLKSLRTSRKELEERTAELEVVKTQLQGIDTEVDNINSSIRNTVNRRETILSNKDHFQSKLSNRQNEQEFYSESLKTLALKFEKNVTAKMILDDKIMNLEQDLNKPFQSVLSEDEEFELDEISNSITTLSKRLDITVESIESIQTSLQELELELNGNLLVQRNDLQAKIASHSNEEIRDKKEALDSLKMVYQDIQKEVEEAEANISSIQHSIENLNGEKSNNEKTLEKANSQQRLLLRKIEDYQKDVEKTMVKKTTLVSRRDEVQQKIREIGLLDEDALNNFSDLSSDELLKKLNEVSESISGITNVNKRAFENFKKFNEKQQELSERATELEESKSSIQDLIERLKQQKITAVDTTFKKVSENFISVFESLVPRGTAKLIIHRSDDDDDDDDSTDSNIDLQTTNNDPIYTGVSISVSFNSKKNEQLHVEQLSGGQKTVCAIALILAIQMVDPAPFYLFDEIDAALDKQYRTAVASTLKKLSRNAQFICTTFRTDMLQVADTFFRVKYENKISSIVEISRQEAINFIRGSNKLAEV